MNRWIEELKALPEFAAAMLGMVSLEELLVAASQKISPPPVAIDNEFVKKIIDKEWANS
jgi:hypothetical protein